MQRPSTITPENCKIVIVRAVVLFYNLNFNDSILQPFQVYATQYKHWTLNANSAAYDSEEAPRLIGCLNVLLLKCYVSVIEEKTFFPFNRFCKCLNIDIEAQRLEF